MTPTVVIDTNVLVSALLSDKDDAATVLILTKVLSGGITLIFSDAIIKEYRQVLEREKFGFSREKTDYLLAFIEKFGVRISPPSSGAALPDLKDLPFYDAALSGRNQDVYLVTGNTRHFPDEDFIVAPRDFIRLMENGISNQ